MIQENWNVAEKKASILIPDAQTRAMLAAIRSLGRAGYDTHAIATTPNALGLHSKYAKHRVVAPDFSDPGFLDWLEKYCRDNAISMIVPSSSMLDAVRPRFSEFSSLLPVSADPEVVYCAGDKIKTFNAYQNAPAHLGLLEHHPLSLVASREHHPSESELGRLELPVYVKASARDADTAISDGVWECRTHEEAARCIARLLRDYRQVLAQAGVDGVQVCVSALIGANGPIALNSVRDSHANPHSSGTMSLRHTWWHQGIVDDAVARLSLLGWRGCAMVEYRWVPSSDNFHVIEINARFWQYLHLDLYSGVDFPALMAEWFLEGRTPKAPTPRQSVECRDAFPGEVAQLVNVLRDRNRSVATKLGDVARFFGRFLDPRIHADLLFPNDRLIYVRELRRFILTELGKR